MYKAGLLLERPLGHATAAASGWDHVVRLRETHGWYAGIDTGEAVATHTRIVAIEEWGINWIVGCTAPVPVLMSSRQKPHPIWYGHYNGELTGWYPV